MLIGCPSGWAWLRGCHALPVTLVPDSGRSYGDLEWFQLRQLLMETWGALDDLAPWGTTPQAWTGRARDFGTFLRLSCWPLEPIYVWMLGRQELIWDPEGSLQPGAK